MVQGAGHLCPTPYRGSAFLREAGGWQSEVLLHWEQVILLVLRVISFSVEQVPTLHQKDSDFNQTRSSELKDLITLWA